MTTEVSNVTQKNFNNEISRTNVVKTTSAPNSIMIDAINNTSTKAEEPKPEEQQTEIDKIYVQLAKELSKYKITADELKNSNIILRASGISQKNLEESLQKDSFYTKRLIECIKQGLIDSVENGKINLDKAIQTSNIYIIALATGWESIEDYKKESKAYNGQSLIATLIEKGYLEEGKTSKDDIKEAAKNLFSKTIAKIKKENPSVNEVKEELKIFGVLVNNSTNEEKALFVTILKELKAENKLQGMDVLFKSCTTPEEREQLANNITNDDLKEIIKNVDKENAIGISKIRTQYQSEDLVTSNHKEYNDERQAWFKENQTKLKDIQDKIQKAEENNKEVKLTDDEKNLLKEYENFIIGISSGEILGTADGNFSKEFKNAHLETLNRDIYTTPVYSEVFKEIANYIEKNPQELSLKTKDIEELLNKASNNNYTRIAENKNEKLVEPKTIIPKEETKTKKEVKALGFETNENFNNEEIRKLQFKLKKDTEENRSFKIEKRASQTFVPENKVKMLNTNTSKQKVDFIREYIDKSTTLRTILVNFLSRTPDAINFLNLLPNNARNCLAEKLVLKGNLKEKEIKKINLSFDKEKFLLKLCEEQQKKNDRNILT